MLDDLIVGIKTQYDATAGATLRGLLTGGMWYPQAKQGVTFPYIVIQDISDIATDTYEKEIDYIHLQFSILHDDIDPMATGGVNAIDDALKALYHKQTLTVSGGTNFGSRFIRRGNMPIENKIFHRYLEFEFYVEKT
jgi:hypothetical protein